MLPILHKSISNMWRIVYRWWTFSYYLKGNKSAIPKNPNQTILHECGTCMWLSTSIPKETLSSTKVFLLEVETQHLLWKLLRHACKLQITQSTFAYFMYLSFLKWTDKVDFLLKRRKSQKLFTSIRSSTCTLSSIKE